MRGMYSLEYSHVTQRAMDTTRTHDVSLEAVWYHMRMINYQPTAGQAASHF